jgi:hypothetical protein
MGALAGVLATLVFTVVHALTIVPIWFSLLPMLVAGAACGFSLAWSYSATGGAPTARGWLTFNGIAVAILFGIGVASFLVFEPRVTMAQLMLADDPLGDVIPPAVPLMLAGIVVGTIMVWLSFGRRVSALVPIVLSQALLVFLVGLNFAILGMVEMSADLVPVLWTFLWLTILLGAMYAAIAMALARLASRAHVTA